MKTLKEKILDYSRIQKKLNCSKGTISYHVGVGQKDKTLKRNKGGINKIKKFLQEYKSKKNCADCKENYPYWMMEFDHIRDKKFTIGRFGDTTRDLEVIKEEILKCEVVCANCHKNRTFIRSTKHGDNVGWENCNYPK